jgi:hypothetical protein
MRITKTLIAAALSALVAGSAIAGGFAQPIEQPPVVIVDSEVQRSSWGIILPLAALALLVGLASGSDDES